MFGSCKLLFVLLYLIFEQNAVRGSPVEKLKISAPLLGSEANRLKDKEENAVQEGDEPSQKEDADANDRATDENKEAPKDTEDKIDAPAESDGKNEEANDGDEKKEDENDGDNKKEEAKDDGEKDGKADEENDKPKLKTVEISFAMEDDTASLHWPLGIVPYYLDSTVFDFIVAYNLRKAMDLIESVSCIKFKTLMLVPEQNTTWINITNPNKVRECVHEQVDGKGEEIVMVLGFDCMKQKQILHTLLHAIGFKDEIAHPLRDQYIHVLWDNIQPKYLHLFREQPNEVVARTLYEYDPASIMHFHDRAFSKNGQATIQPLLPGLQVGPSDTLSALDKLKLRTLFGRECNKRDVIGLQESCKNVMSKKLKSPDDDGLGALEVLKKGVKGKGYGRGKGKKQKKTPSMEEKEKKKEEIKKDDDPRSSEQNA